MSSQGWLVVEPAEVKRMDSAQIREQLQAWKVAQKHQLLHEQRTRIIVSPHHHHRAASPASLSALKEKEPFNDDEVEPPLVQQRYASMKERMEEEVVALRCLIAAPQPEDAGSAESIEDEHGRDLPPASTSLLGVFSPHRISHHLPTLYSYPVFTFHRG